MEQHEPGLPGESAVRTRLRVALRRARLDRERVLVAAVGSAIAALENAEAVPLDRAPAGGGPAGGGDVDRRALSEDTERRLLATEVEELRQAAATYDEIGQPERAEETRRSADVIEQLTSRT